MAIALSPGGSSIYTSPSPSTRLLVATVHAIVQLEGEPQSPSWRVTGRFLVSPDGGETWRLAASRLPPVSKGDHYRRFDGY